MKNENKNSNDHVELQDLDPLTNSRHLDRKKRDTNTKTGQRSDDELDTTNPVIASGNPAENRRRARQLRPPPVGGQPTWQYDATNTAYQYSQTPSTYQSDGVSFDYNPFLTLPSAGGSSQQFKNGANYYQSASPQKSESHSSFTSGGRAEQSNTVREYSLYKTSTGFADQPKEVAFARGNTGTLTPESYLPLYVSNNAQKPRKTADTLSDNFSYFHIGSSEGNGERESHNQHKKEPSLYIVHKPKPVLGALGSTPKSHVIQVSTVGGFFNNNPTIDPFASYKKSKLRPHDDANFGTHKPLYQKTASPVYETSYDKDYYSFNEHSSSEFLPVPGTTLTPTTAASQGHRYIVNNAKNVVLKPSAGNFQNHPSIYSYRTEDVPTTAKTGFFITRTENGRTTTPAPALPWASLTWKPSNKTNLNDPRVQIPIGFNKFLSDLRDKQLTQTRNSKLNSSPYGFQSSDTSIPVSGTSGQGGGGKASHSAGPKNTINITYGKAVPQKPPTTPTTTSNPDDYYYDDEDEDELSTTEPNEVGTGRAKPIIPSRDSSFTTVKSIALTKIPTGYDGRSQKNSPFGVTHPTAKPNTTTPADDEYYYYDDGWSNTQAPRNISEYMPMSETAAPRLRVTSVTPATTKKYTPFNFGQSGQSQYHGETSSIPPIIKFPDDVFHGLRPMHQIPRYLNKSTIRPYTIRTRLRTTGSAEVTTQSPRTTVAPGTSSTQKIYSSTPYRTINRFKPSKTSKKLDGPWEYDERHQNR